MSSKSFKRNSRAALLGLIAAAYPVVGYTAPAARVDFAVGNVKAVGPNGQSRTIGKGAQIEQGETIATNNGRAQLRFTDGAYVSLQPESEFRIDQYRFDGKQDGNEKGFFSLVKGGLRTITGLVGRNNKNNYQITTSVATIGIRGTEYTIQYGQSITGSVGEGEINVCNGAGCLSVMNGESYYVQSQEIKPTITNKRTDLPPPSPQNPPSTFVQGDTVDESGTPCSLGGGCGALVTGTGAFYIGQGHGSSAFVILDANATVQGGQLQQYQQQFGSPAILTGFSNIGGDDLIAWGTAASCTGGECSGPLNYVVGRPGDVGPLAQMNGTYTMLGRTPILDFNGNTVGSLGKADMTVFFGGGFVNGTMKMEITLKDSPSGTSSTTSLNNLGLSGCGPSFSVFTSCGNALNVSGAGFFTGSRAERAGIVYSVDNGSVFGNGAAGMIQTSLQPSQVQ